MPPKKSPTTSNGKYTHSPDTYDDTSLGAEPGRKHYSPSPENVVTETHPKRAGGIPGKVQQETGTDSPRANQREKSAGMPDVPKGKTRWGDVASYNDSAELP